MLSLSQSLANHEVYACYALLEGRKYRTALTHPFDAESRFDNSAYKRHLWQQMQNPHSATYKDLVRLARAHLAGKRVVLRIHQNAKHGDVILAAITYIADQLQPVPKAHGSSPHHGVSVWSDKDEYELLDERRLVWVIGQGEARLGYVWDTEGVLTALVPRFGLIKLGRVFVIEESEEDKPPKVFATNFWLLRYNAIRNHTKQLTEKVYLATLGKTGLHPRIEHKFTRLIKRQQTTERTEVACYHTGVEFGLTEKIEYEERHDPWFIHQEEPIDEPPADEADKEVVEETNADTHSRFFKLPTRYQGPHVKPVVKTKPDGSRWVLTPTMQARGALHLYRRI